MTEQELPEVEKDEKKGFPSIYEMNMGIEPGEPVCAETCEELRTAKMQMGGVSYSNRPILLSDKVMLLQGRIIGLAEHLYETHEANEDIEDALLGLFELLAELKEMRQDARG